MKTDFLVNFYHDSKSTIKKRPLLFLLLTGLLCLIISSVCTGDNQLIKTIKSVLHASGIGIIGAGVFAALLKSNQFSELFKKQITQVIYTPGEYQSQKELWTNWQRLSKALLGNVLPFSNDVAISFLRNTFFNNVLQYHFKDYRVSYSVKWKDPDKGIVEVVSRTEANIIPSNSVDKCKFVFFQKVNKTDDSSIEIQRFLIGDSDFKDRIEEKITDNKKRIFLEAEIPHGKNIKLDRIVKFTQMQKNENFIKGKLIRYIKSVTVAFQYEKNQEYPDAPMLTPRFEALGFNKHAGQCFREDLIDEHSAKYEWKCDGLLLPHQGYIIMLYEES